MAQDGGSLDDGGILSVVPLATASIGLIDGGGAIHRRGSPDQRRAGLAVLLVGILGLLASAGWLILAFTSKQWFGEDDGYAANVIGSHRIRSSRSRRQQRYAAGAGLSPAGGSLRSSEARPAKAAPETVDPSHRSQGGGPRGNQGFPREGERSDAEKGETPGCGSGGFNP
jgi:hypothetical protein